MGDYDDNKVEIIESNKGGLKLIFRGYMYTVHKRRTNGAIRWRCTQRSMFCKGSITTYGKNSNLAPTPNMPHNHVPDPYSVAMARSRRVRPINEEEQPYDEEEDKSFLKREIYDNPPEIDIFDKPELHVEVIMDPPVLNKEVMASTPPVVTPVKVSQRILTQKAQQLIQQQQRMQQQQQTTQQKENRHGDPLEMVQKQASASLTVRKVQEVPKIAPPPEEDEVCLRWNSHYNNIQSMFPSLLAREQFVDVTLCSEGQSIRCHKLVLSACSSYFEEIISNMNPWQHPVIFLKGIPFWVLKALIDYMYVGETSIEQSKLKIILDAGEELKIKGLAAKKHSQSQPSANSNFTFTKPDNMSTTKPDMSTTNSATPPKMWSPPRKVYKVGLTKDQLKKFNPDEMQKIVTQQKDQEELQLPPQLQPAVGGIQPQQSLLRKNIIPLSKKDLPVPEQKKILKTVVLKSKKTQKRRLSESSSSPVPEQLLFVRKGTKSRPLVKTPRFYHTEFEDDPKPPPKLEKNEKIELRQTPNYIDPIDNEMTLQKSKEQDIPVNTFKLVEIKQEPLDIGETDVSYTQEQDILTFDNPEDIEGESDITMEQEEVLLDEPPENEESQNDQQEVTEENVKETNDGKSEQGKEEKDET